MNSVVKGPTFRQLNILASKFKPETTHETAIKLNRVNNPLLFPIRNYVNRHILGTIYLH